MNIVSVLVFQSLNCELCYVTEIIMKHDKHVTVVDSNKIIIIIRWKRRRRSSERKIYKTVECLKNTI